MFAFAFIQTCMGGEKSSQLTWIFQEGDDSHEKNESWSGHVEWKQLLCKQVRMHTEADVLDKYRQNTTNQNMPAILPLLISSFFPSPFVYGVSLSLYNQPFSP